MNLRWWLERASWEHADKPAVIDADGTETTFAALRSLSDRIANVLERHLGVGADDVVVTVMPDDHLHVATFYAVLGVGAAFSGLNRRQAAEKFAADVRRSRPKAAIVTPETAHIGHILRAEGVPHVLVTRGGEGGFDSLEELCRGVPDAHRIASRSQDDVAAINFTAGTSGASKGVVFTHGTLGTSAFGAICNGGVTSRCRNLSLVGMFHSGGIHDAIRLVMAGGTIIWSDGWDVERVVGLIERHRPDWMYWIVPTMVRDLMRHPAWPGLDLAGLRTHVCGELVPPDMEEALRRKGVVLGSVYGLTEAMPVCVLSSSIYYGDRAPTGSSGRPDRQFCEVKLKDPFTGEEVAGGDVEGEICIRGDVVTPGYYNDPQRTAEAIDAEGFLHTRDLGHRDGDGWYTIRGRTDDMILSGAEKLSLLEVDAALLCHPAVADAGCIGVRHERFGEVPAAFVVLAGLDAGVPGLEAGEDARAVLDAHCLSRMERWKRPRLYVFVPEVPRTAAKRSKMQGEMRRRLGDLVLRDRDGVTTLAALTGARNPVPEEAAAP